MVEEQQKKKGFPITRDILAGSCSTSLVLQPLPKGQPPVTLHCDVSTNRIRPFVPDFFQLKAAIMAHVSAQWTAVFPTILLRYLEGGSTSHNCGDDYGDPIRLPGEFLCSSEQNATTNDPASQCSVYLLQRLDIPDKIRFS
ncbi:hypothetical protein NPIL_350811 [Nephila pilipes]|uniref:Uncharacterized protein n=1 Tax=Nephila pilipes TaxID=299642 RepID=A0A8X6UF15_NEPPI|nr:hypothetical protein NPIL_350811 [Nephila pilipes]